MAEIPDGYVAIPKADHDLYTRVYALSEKLWNHPEVGATFQEKAAELEPKIKPDSTRYAHILNPLNDEIKTLKENNATLLERLGKVEQTTTDKEAIADLSKKLADAQAKYRLTAAGMEEVKKLIVEGRANDPDMAAQYVAANIERAPSTATGSNFGPTDLNAFDMDGTSDDDDTKALHTDPVKWLDKAVPKIMSEFEQDAA